MQVVLESSLPQPKHISEVEPRTERDDALFAELAAVLKKHNALNRFGVTLLHSHFGVRPGECLLETTDEEARQQAVRPVTLESLAGQDYIETSWSLGDGFVAMRCVCQDRDGQGHKHWPRR